MMIIVMGISGAGKSTVARRLAEDLNCPFYEGDEDHPPDNIRKMTAGIPLSDANRLPWLRRLGDRIKALGNQTAVLSCSALRETYRQELASYGSVFWVYLHIDKALAFARMGQRAGHYMPTLLLQSQWDALEEPAYGLRLDASLPVEELVAEIGKHLPR